MAVSFVAAGTVTAVNGTSAVNVPSPSGLADGDYVLLFVLVYQTTNTTAPTVPAGFTQLWAYPQGQFRVGIYVYGRAASSDPANYAVNQGFSNSDPGCAWSVAYRGVNTSAAVVTSSSQSPSNQTGVTTISAPSLTATAADEMYVSWCVAYQGSTRTLTSSTQTLRVNTGQSARSAGVAEQAASGAGSISGETFTSNTAADYYAGALILAVSAGGGGAALAGAATASASASATMSVNKPLAGSAQGQATATGTLNPSLPGFAFDTDADCILGEIVGALTGIAREASGTNYIVRAYDVATGALVDESGTLTTDGNGRLPRWQDAGFSAATAYHLIFVRVSDGAIGSKRMVTT